MWKDYEGKPITRKACEIKEEGILTQLIGMESTWQYIELGNERVQFKAYEYPKVGDFIVRLTEEDTYHCTKAVFHARNIVPNGE